MYNKIPTTLLNLFTLLYKVSAYDTITSLTMVSTAATTSIIIAVVIAIIAVALGGAYTQGYLDPVIEKIGIFLFKAKAEAEKKKLQAEGLKEGEDFLDSRST